MDESSKPTLFEALQFSISNERLATYLKSAGFDEERALRLYLWNAAIGEAFPLPIQGVEVGLRNCVNMGLTATFNSAWWECSQFLGIADRERKADLATAQSRITNRGYAASTSQVVANLSFGFWVGVLQARYNPDIWSKCIRNAFPNLPDTKNRGDLAVAAKRIADLRNRIWHHEPIFKMNLSEEFRAIMELLSWICPAKAGWIRPQCRVLHLLRQKP